jgi:hypothetical protein
MGQNGVDVKRRFDHRRFRAREKELLDERWSHSARYAG